MIVRSSTSNSSSRLPEGRWGAVWLLTLILLALLTIAVELALRAGGFSPSVDPDGPSWLAERGRLAPDSTVLVGTSRMQSNLDPAAWADITGGARKPVNLALAGSSARPVFESLTSDPEFHGIIIYDVVPRFAFGATTAAEEVARAHLDSYVLQRSSPARRLDGEFYKLRAGKFVLTNPELRITRLVEFLYTLELPKVSATLMRPDRFVERSYSNNQPDIDVSAYESYFLRAGQPTHEQLTSQLRRFDSAVKRHQSKGGTVVFIAMPVCGAVADLTETYFPRARYWDRLVEEVAGIKLRANDYPELSQFKCTDGSHLEFRDAVRFTHAIAKLLGYQESL